MWRPACEPPVLCRPGLLVLLGAPQTGVGAVRGNVYILTAEEALQHQWIPQFDEDRAMSGNRPLTIKRTLTNFVQMHKLKEAAQQLLAENLTQTELQDLGGKFRRLDSMQNGRLTIGQMKQALHDIGYEVDDQLIDVVDQLETDHDNKMSYVEILDEAMAMNDQIAEENVVRVFAFLDKDRTGAISCGDIVDQLETDNVNQEDVVQVLTHFDLSRSGRIGFQEFKMLVRRLEENSGPYKTLMNIGYAAPTEDALEGQSRKIGSAAPAPASVTPPLPPTQEEEVSEEAQKGDTGAAAADAEPEPERTPEKRNSIKFHRPSIIKSLFPKEKDKKDAVENK